MDVRVSFYLKKSETNADGCCPVMARLTVGNHSEAAFSAKMSVPVSSWASGRATGKSAATREINRQLDELRASALAIYKEQSAIREDVTAEEVRDLLLGKASGQTTLLNYFQTFIEHFEKRVGVNREKDTLATPATASPLFCKHSINFRIFPLLPSTGRSSTGTTSTCGRNAASRRELSSC